MIFKTNLTPTTRLLDLTPLINVAFLMLVFFIITSNVLPLKSLHIESPTLNYNSPPLTTQILVVMDAQNVLYVGSKKEIVDFVTLKEKLSAEIQALKERHPTADPTVVLSVDRRVEYGIFLKLFATTQECSSRIRLVYKSEESNA